MSTASLTLERRNLASVSSAPPALLAEAYRPSERAKVQALNDFLVFGTVAVASFGSGQLLHSVGWNGINFGMLPMVAVVLVLLSWQGLRQRRLARTPA